MSDYKMSVHEVEELLENHGFYQPAYEKTAYVSGRGYVKTGEIIPERWNRVADGDDGWDLWQEALGKAYYDATDGRYLKGEEMFEVVEGLGNVYLEQQFGGEGMGDNYYIILRVEPFDDTDTDIRFFRKNGYHASHDGSYLDGTLDEVTPVARTVTFYE